MTMIIATGLSWKMYFISSRIITFYLDFNNGALYTGYIKMNNYWRSSLLVVVRRANQNWWSEIISDIKGVNIIYILSRLHVTYIFNIFCSFWNANKTKILKSMCTSSCCRSKSCAAFVSLMKMMMRVFKCLLWEIM